MVCYWSLTNAQVNSVFFCSRHSIKRNYRNHFVIRLSHLFPRMLRYLLYGSANPVQYLTRYLLIWFLKWTSNLLVPVWTNERYVYIIKVSRPTSLVKILWSHLTKITLSKRKQLKSPSDGNTEQSSRIMNRRVGNWVSATTA